MVSSWKHTRERIDAGLESTFTSPTSSPVPDKMSETQLGRVDESKKTGLPSPFWPISLQHRQLEALKQTGEDQSPALPDVFVPMPKNETPHVTANVVNIPFTSHTEIR